MITEALAVSWVAVWAGCAATAALRLRRAHLRPGRPVAPAVIVRPCAGAPAHLPESLASAPSLSGIPVMLTAARRTDSAWEWMAAAQQSLRARNVEAHVIVANAGGTNEKVAQLAAVASCTDAEVLVNVDSDVDLATVDLAALLSAVHGEVALAWIPPVEDRAHTLGDRASQAILGGSLHAFRVLSALDPAGVTGKVFAIRTDALARIGGFATVSEVLGEDMELGVRLRAAGFRTIALPRTCRSLVSGRRFRDVVRRYARWLTVIRTQRPVRLLGYPLLFGAAVPLLVLAAIVGGPLGAGLGLSTLVLRLAIARMARSASELPVTLRHVVIDSVLADVTLWLALAAALARPTVAWRGRRLRVGRGGVLRALNPS